MEVHKLRQDLNLISVQYLCEQCDYKVAEKPNLVELLKLIHYRVQYHVISGIIRREQMQSYKTFKFSSWGNVLLMQSV